MLLQWKGDQNYSTTKLEKIVANDTKRTEDKRLNLSHFAVMLLKSVSKNLALIFRDYWMSENGKNLLIRYTFSPYEKSSLKIDVIFELKHENLEESSVISIEGHVEDNNTFIPVRTFHKTLEKNVLYLAYSEIKSIVRASCDSWKDAQSFVGHDMVESLTHRAVIYRVNKAFEAAGTKDPTKAYLFYEPVTTQYLQTVLSKALNVKINLSNRSTFLTKVDQNSATSAIDSVDYPRC